MKPKNPPRRNPLTPAEEAFVAEYLANGCHAARAYMALHPRVGAASARTLAARMLAKVNVRAAVRRGQRRLARRSGVHARRVLDEFGHVAFADIGQVLDLKTFTIRPHLPPEVRRAVAVLEQVTTTTRRGVTRTTIQVRMHDKLAALDRLCRHLGLFRELPPLEAVLALLPPAVAAAIREELARHAATAGDPPADGA
jgi:phage terminase small subunit